MEGKVVACMLGIYFSDWSHPLALYSKNHNVTLVVQMLQSIENSSTHITFLSTYLCQGLCYLTERQQKNKTPGLSWRNT